MIALLLLCPGRGTQLPSIPKRDMRPENGVPPPPRRDLGTETGVPPYPRRDLETETEVHHTLPPVKQTDKKVLLRERKRHTARRVASARYAALSNGWVGGVPPTIQTWPGYPPPLGWGTPPPSRPGRVPPTPGMGYPPPSRPVWGTSPPQTWDEVPPPPPQTWDGVPPLPASVNRLKISPSSILRMRAAKIVPSRRTPYEGGKNNQC